jgi:metal-responsive CopG/Arc/MetJ family transcriptional regulator
VSTRESLWLHVDEELLRQLDALAASKGVTRHELARIAMRLGVEAMRPRRRDGER